MRQGLERVVAVVNGKGGVGKTTITANIGGMLAASGYRVLLVDMDPPGNLAGELGYTKSAVKDDRRALDLAVLLGFDDAGMADDDQDLAALREHPGWAAVRARLGEAVAPH